MNKDKLENSSLLRAIEHMWKYLLNILHDMVELFALEAKLANKSLMRIIILLPLTAILLLSSWFSLLGAFITWLLTWHVGLIAILLVISAVNLIGALAIGLYIVKISTHLQFKETRRQLEIWGESDAATTSEN